MVIKGGLHVFRFSFYNKKLKKKTSQKLSFLYIL